MTENNFSVYMHKCPNGKVYIGITSRDCQERWKKGHGYSNNKHFKNAINHYGWDNIEHIIIKSNLTKDEACTIEQDLIKRYDATNREKGYNKSIGGELSSLGFHHTKEAREKIGKAGLGRKPSPKAIEKSSEARRKSVDVYDLQGNLIKRCKSATEAEKITGVDNSNIVATCKGRYKQTKGYIFRYAGENIGDIKSPHRKPVKMFTLDGEYIKTFSTIKDASKELGIADTHISDCCKGKFKKSGGYIWRYA